MSLLQDCKFTFSHLYLALPSIALLVHPLYIIWEVFHILFFFFETT